jgi:hypothetical protein
MAMCPVPLFKKTTTVVADNKKAANGRFIFCLPLGHIHHHVITKLFGRES